MQRNGPQRNARINLNVLKKLLNFFIFVTFCVETNFHVNIFACFIHIFLERPIFHCRYNFVFDFKRGPFDLKWSKIFKNIFQKPFV